MIVLARVMTEVNRHEVLPRFFHLSRQEAEQVAVEIRPVEVVPTEDGRDRGAGFHAGDVAGRAVAPTPGT